MTLLNRPHKRTFLSLAAAALLLLFALPRTALSAEVLILKDSDIKPFREAIRGFTDSCGCTVQELELSGSDVLKKVRETKPDALFAVGTLALRKAAPVRSIPVVYTMAMPSVVASLAAGNALGVSMDVSPEAYLDAMERLFPGRKRIGILSDPRRTGLYVAEAASAARNRGMTLIVKQVDDIRQVPDLLNELRDRIDLFWMLPDATVVTSDTVDYLMLFSFQNKIPIFSFASKYVEQGAVAALAIDPRELGGQAGRLLKRLLRGEKVPPQVYAADPRLIVNEKIAEKLGIRIEREGPGNAEPVE